MCLCVVRLCRRGGGDCHGGLHGFDSTVEVVRERASGDEGKKKGSKLGPATSVAFVLVKELGVRWLNEGIESKRALSCEPLFNRQGGKRLMRSKRVFKRSGKKAPGR